MPVSYITENLVDQLKIMEPFGCANSKPLFAQKNLSVLSARILGARRNVLKMRVADEQGYEMDAIYFGNIDDFNQYLSSHFPQNEIEYMYQGRKNSVRLSFTYYPDVNEFRGTKTLQLIIQNYQ
jgi:single-stranded-DNA-specific exonuclease